MVFIVSFGVFLIVIVIVDVDFSVVFHFASSLLHSIVINLGAIVICGCLRWCVGIIDTGQEERFCTKEEGSAHHADHLILV